MAGGVTVAQLFDGVKQRFRADKAVGVSLTFHFDIAGAGQYTIAIQNGECNVFATFSGIADCIITTDNDTYIGLETGNINPQEALIQGKVQVSNLMAMLDFAKYFKKYEMPAAQQPAGRGKRHLPEGPLSGIRVIDFSRLLPGPLTTLFMAQMGAEVIKVEDPQSPDYIRNFPPFINGQSAYYLALNSGKYSVSISFSKQKEQLLGLITQADILVEQYRPGVMGSMGFGYEAVKAINPRIIYCSITGYGQTGNMAQLAGHDLNYLAESGLLGLNTDENGKPIMPAFQLADVAGGSNMALTACLAALFQRERTGRGQYLDVAMTKNVVPVLALPLAAQQTAGHTIKELAGHIANYNIYSCSDGRYVALGALEPKFWAGFCKAVNKPHWEGRIAKMDKLSTDGLKNDLKALFASQNTQYWVGLGKQFDICISSVKQLDELLTDEYLQQSGAFSSSTFNEETIYGMKFPVEMGANNSNMPHAPFLGEDNSLFL